MELLYYGYAIKAYQKKIESLAEGSTGQMEMNLHHLKNEIVIKYPISLKTQHEVGCFLKNLDDKIAINRKKQLIAITRELTRQLRKSRTVDWEKKESARAGMRRMVKRLLKSHLIMKNNYEIPLKAWSQSGIFFVNYEYSCFAVKPY